MGLRGLVQGPRFGHFSHEQMAKVPPPHKKNKQTKKNNYWGDPGVCRPGWTLEEWALESALEEWALEGTLEEQEEVDGRLDSGAAGGLDSCCHPRAWEWSVRWAGHKKCDNNII